MEQPSIETNTRKEIERAAYDYPVLEFDAEEFWHFVESYDLSDDEKREYLEVIWSIIVSFVDLGFGIHPVQKACGKLTDNFSKTALTASDEIYLPCSKHDYTTPEKGGAP